MWRDAAFEVDAGEYLNAIGRMSPYRFDELICLYQNKNNRTYKKLFLMKDPRIFIGQMLLWALAGWIAGIMLL